MTLGVIDWDRSRAQPSQDLSAWPSRARPRMVTPIESLLFVNLHFCQIMADLKILLWFHSKTITISWPWAKNKSIYDDYPFFQRSRTAFKLCHYDLSDTPNCEFVLVSCAHFGVLFWHVHNLVYHIKHNGTNWRRVWNLLYHWLVKCHWGAEQLSVSV